MRHKNAFLSDFIFWAILLFGFKKSRSKERDQSADKGYQYESIEPIFFTKRKKCDIIEARKAVEKEYVHRKK